MATVSRDVTCPGCQKVFTHEFPTTPGVDIIQQGIDTILSQTKTLHDHVDELRAAAQKGEDRLVATDIAGPVTDALAPLDRRLEAIQEAVTSHPSPAQTIEHWKSCPTCSKEYEATLDTIRPLTKVEPPALVSAPPKPEEKPRPPSPKRRLYQAVEDIPESAFVRGSYGISTVQEPDGRFSLQADSEEAGKRALEAGVLEKGCSLKCDETGCWRVCEPE